MSHPKSLPSSLLDGALRLATSPSVLRLAADPRVARALVGLATLGSRVEDTLRDAGRMTLARLDLVTRSEIVELEQKLERLERQLKEVQS